MLEYKFFQNLISSKKKYFFFLFVGLLFSQSQTKLEELTKLKSNSNNYIYHPIETFDTDSVWEVIHKHTYLSSIQLTKKVPSGDLFEVEKTLFEKTEVQFPKSLQLHGNIEIPGRDKIQIQNIEKKFFPSGRPVRISIWVYSNNYPIKLRGIIQHKKAKDFFVDFGELNFHGWQRLEAKVNIIKNPNRLNLSKLEEFSLGSLVFESLPKMTKTDFVVYIDQICIVIEKYKDYDGSEIPDGWYFE